MLGRGRVGSCIKKSFVDPLIKLYRKLASVTHQGKKLDRMLRTSLSCMHNFGCTAYEFRFHMLGMNTQSAQQHFVVAPVGAHERGSSTNQFVVRTNVHAGRAGIDGVKACMWLLAPFPPSAQNFGPSLKAPPAAD